MKEDFGKTLFDFSLSTPSMNRGGSRKVLNLPNTGWEKFKVVVAMK